MTCEVCGHHPAKGGQTCGPECESLRCMAAVQAQTDAAYPGQTWVADERAQLLWDFRRRWHEVRGLPFQEEPPKTDAMRELERLDLIRGEP